MDETKKEKTYTSNEVTKLLDDQRAELREKAIEKIKEAREDNLPQGEGFFNANTWKIMRVMADDMSKSGALPRSDNAYTVMLKMQVGREMGLGPVESINSLYVVNGVTSVWGKALVKRLREHGWMIEYTEKENACTAKVTKKDEVYSETFTFEEAQKSGWTRTQAGGLKPAWIEGINRRLKLRYGALSVIVKTYIPEVLGAAVDVAEVAEDMIQVIEGKSYSEKVAPKLADGSAEATPVQKETIKAMGGDDKDIKTKQQASDLIVELSNKNGSKK